MEALKVDGVTKIFGGILAVNNISFRVNAGEKLAIIGPNGAGKTTLFNMINGQERVTSGRIYFFGDEITNSPTHRRAHLGQARSFQLTSLFLNLTVFVNTFLAVQGTTSSRYNPLKPVNNYKSLIAKAETLLAEMGLLDRKDDVVESLSYGEQRKLEITLSLASKPKLLLLDEPNCGLTPAESADMISLIRKLGLDLTILLVAHDMDLVFNLAERIMVLHYGEIIVDGTPEEIRNNLRVKEIYMGLPEGEANAGTK